MDSNDHSKWSDTTIEIRLRDGTESGIRFTSGETVYDEALVSGRLIGRYWSADGFVRPERVIEGSYGENQLSPLEAFKLEVDGQSLGTGWTWADATVEDEDGAKHATVYLVHGRRPVEVRVHTRLDGTAILERWLEITNTGDDFAAVSTVRPWSGRLWPHRREFTLGTFTAEKWGREGWLEWSSLPTGPTVLEDEKGQSFNSPFFLVRNEEDGGYAVGALAWPANWQIAFHNRRDDLNETPGLAFEMGPDAPAPQRVVAPGETVTSPRIHLGMLEGTFDDAVQAMHQHIRRSVLPSMDSERAYRIQFAVPGDQSYYTAFPESDPNTPVFEAENLRQAVDVADAIGAETFILDAWWWDVSGDWTPSSDRFPDGLAPLVEYVHDLDMDFGLYVEIEGGRDPFDQRSLGPLSESWIGREHPEWLGAKNVLDLANPDCAAWVEDEIERMITEYGVDLYRIDFNPQYTYDGSASDRDCYLENDYWRYYETFFEIFERVSGRHPDVVLQQAAAGGARNDLAMAARFHESYLTDGLEFPNVTRVYSGQTVLFPPEILVTGYGGTPLERRAGSLDTHLRLTFTTGTPWLLTGVAPSVDELTENARARFDRYVDIYRRIIRPTLPTAKVYHHAPVTSRRGVADGGWFAMEYASPDGETAWATLVRIDGDSDSYCFRPRGLDVDRSYRVTVDSQRGSVIMDGLEIASEGITVRCEAVGTSELLLFEAA